MIANVYFSRSGIGDEVSSTLTLNGLEQQVLPVIDSKPFPPANLNEVVNSSRDHNEICMVMNLHGCPEVSKC